LSEAASTAIYSVIKESSRDVLGFGQEKVALFDRQIADQKSAVPLYTETLFKRGQTGSGFGSVDGFGRHLATSDPSLLRIGGLFQEIQASDWTSLRSSFDVYERPALTSDRGFALAVVEMAQSPLSVYRGQPDLNLPPGVFTEYQIQSDVFAHTEADAVVKLMLTQVDGQSLPTWVQFNGKTGKLLINPPEGFTGDLVLRLVAVDQAGREVVTIFRISIREPGQMSEGRVSFTDKIKESMESLALSFLGHKG